MTCANDGSVPTCCTAPHFREPDLRTLRDARGRRARYGRIDNAASISAAVSPWRRSHAEGAGPRTRPVKRGTGLRGGCSARFPPRRRRSGLPKEAKL